MTWNLKIMDPNGETRFELLNRTARLGRNPDRCTILLHDATALESEILITSEPQRFIPNLYPTPEKIRSSVPTLPGVAGVTGLTGLTGLKGTLEDHPEQERDYWLLVNQDSPPARLGSVPVRQCLLPEGVPLNIGETTLTLIRELNSRFLRPPLPPRTQPWKTQTPQGLKLLWTAHKTAQSPLSIYLRGETGTGKEVMAKLIHAWSPRKEGPFVPLHCAALSQNLAESELFGHVKGSFTGASQNRTGALIQAHGGTLFLDEVGDLSGDIQVKLLRFLESGEIKAVGSDRLQHAEVRIVCATHKPLESLVAQGLFRKDLYYRIASVTLAMPPLRERVEDIELLTKDYAELFQRYITPSALRHLQSYDWPGNVRELRHAIERACALTPSSQKILDEGDFDFLLESSNSRDYFGDRANVPVLNLKQMERILLIKALRIAKGNREDTAKLLGIARSTLFEKLKNFGIGGRHARTPLVNPPLGNHHSHNENFQNFTLWQ